MIGTAAWRSEWRSTASKSRVALLQIDLPGGRSWRVGTAKIFANGFWWEPGILGDCIVSERTQFLAGRSDAATMTFALADTRYSWMSTRLSKALANSGFKGAPITLWLGTVTLTNWSDWLQRFTGELTGWTGRGGRVEFVSEQPWPKRTISPRVVTRGEYPGALDETIGAPLPIALGDLSGPPMRDPFVDPYGAEYRIREAIAGGIRAGQALLVDVGKGGGATNPPAKVLVAGHALTQLGSFSPNYGTSPFLAGPDGDLHILDPPLTDIVNGASEAGFVLRDNLSFAWQPVFPIDINPLSTAENPRAILDRKNEVTFAYLDYAALKRELYAKLGPISSPGDAYDAFAYILYQTSAAASGLVFKVRNVKAGGTPTALLTLAPKVVPGWDDQHLVTTGGTIWTTGAMPDNAWDFSECEMWVDFTGTSPAGWCKVFMMGIGAIYRPAQDVTKTEKIVQQVFSPAIQKRLNRLPWTHKQGNLKRIVEAVTESQLKGKFFANTIGLPGDGSPFLVWRDDRGASTQIYIQSTAGSSGAENWTANGVQVGNSSGASRHLTSACCPDGKGGVFVAYLDRRNGTRTDLYAQYYNAAGVAQWAAGGIVLCNASDLEAAVGAGYDCYVAMVPDGAGGFVCSWADCRGATPADRLYITRIDANGTLHSGWTANGNLVMNLTTTGDGRVSGQHSLAASGGVYLCALERSVSFGLKTQIVNASGTLVGATGSFGGVLGGKVIADGLGNFLLNYLGPTNQCGAKKIDATAAVIWTVDAAAATAAISATFILPDGLGGCFVFWRTGSIVHAQRLNSAGTALWASGGVALTASGALGYFFFGVSDGAGGAILVWPDATLQTMNAQRIDANGTLLWGTNGVVFSAVGGSPFGTAAITDGAGGVISFYTIAGDVKAARIAADGTVLWTVNVTNASGAQTSSGAVYPNAADTQSVAGGGPVVKEAPALATLILEKFGDVPAGQIQLAAGLHGSFADAATQMLTWKQSPMVFGVQIAKEIAIEDVLEELGQAAVSCIVRRAADGAWKYFPWRIGAPATYTAPLSLRDLVRPESALELTPTPGPALPSGLVLAYGPDDAGGGFAHEVSIGSARSSAGHLYRNLRDSLLTITTGQADRLDYVGASSGTLAFNLTPGAYGRASALSMLHTALASLSQHAIAFGGLVVQNVNDRLPFKVNGVFKLAILTPGEMTMEARAADAVAAMLAAGSGGVPSCTFSRATRKYTFAMSGVASFGLEFFNAALNSSAALFGFTCDLYFGSLSYTSDGILEEHRFTLSNGEQFNLPFRNGVNGQLGTKRSIWEFLGWDWNEDVIGIGVSPTRAGAIATAICPKFELEQLLAAQPLEPKMPTPAESRWIFETPTALEHRNRSTELGAPARGYSKIRSAVHADAELHDTIDPLADLDQLRGYCVEGSDGTWLGKRITVLETHQHFGTSFDTELGGVDLSA